MHKLGPDLPGFFMKNPGLFLFFIAYRINTLLFSCKEKDTGYITESLDSLKRFTQLIHDPVEFDFDRIREMGVLRVLMQPHISYTMGNPWVSNMSWQ